MAAASAKQLYTPLLLLLLLASIAAFSQASRLPSSSTDDALTGSATGLVAGLTAGVRRIMRGMMHDGMMHDDSGMPVEPRVTSSSGPDDNSAMMTSATEVSGCSVGRNRLVGVCEWQ